MSVTLINCTLDDLRLELTWAVAEVEALQNRLFNAEYESLEWFDALHDLPHVRRRVERLMRVLGGSSWRT